MSTTKRITIVTTCDRPRCPTVISEREEEEQFVAGTMPPAVVIERAGQDTIVYQDLCDRCTKTIGNLCDSIEKKPQEKPEPGDLPADDPEAADPDSDAGPAAGGEEPA